MSEYVRFEVYVPTLYWISRVNPTTGEEDREIHDLDDQLLQRFVRETRQSSQGITQANPMAASPFKGWWEPPANARPHATAQCEGTRSRITIDYLTYLFGLVRIDRQDGARQHFERWKTEFEQNLYQDVVLVIYHSVHVLGDFL